MFGCSPVVSLEMLERPLNILILRKTRFDDLSQLEVLVESLSALQRDTEEKKAGIQKLETGVFYNKAGENERWAALFLKLLKLQPRTLYLEWLVEQQPIERVTLVLHGELPTETLRAQAAVLLQTGDDSASLHTLRDTLLKVPKANRIEKWFRQKTAIFADGVKKLFINTPERHPELIATIVLLDGSLDWVEDFIVTERCKNDMALHWLIDSLQVAVKLPEFPAALQKRVRALIELFRQRDHVRVASHFIDMKRVDLDDLQVLHKALCYVKEYYRKDAWFAEGLSVFYDALIQCLKTRLNDAAFRRILPDLLKSFAFDTQEEFTKKYFTSRPSHESIQLVRLHVPKVKKVAEHLSTVSTLPELSTIQEIKAALLSLPSELHNLFHVQQAVSIVHEKVKASILQPAWDEDLPDMLYTYLQVCQKFDLKQMIELEEIETDELLLDKLLRSLDLLLAKHSLFDPNLPRLLKWRTAIVLQRTHQAELKAIKTLIEETALSSGFELDKVLMSSVTVLHRSKLFKRGFSKLAEWFTTLNEEHHTILIHILLLDKVIRQETIDIVHARGELQYLYAYSPEPYSHFLELKKSLIIMQKEANLSALRVIQLAAFVAFCLPRIDASYIKKDFAISLPRSIIRDRAANRVYILLKSKSTLLNDGGTYKKVTAAIELATETPPQFVAQAVNKDDDENAFNDLRSECTIFDRLQQTKGIWEKRFSLEYIKRKGLDAVKKIACFFPLATGNLHRLQERFSFIDIVSIASQLTSGLAALHALKLLHNDLKGPNALAKIDENGKVQAGLIDFGFAYSHDMNPTGNFKKGFYGSTLFTPPELFGVKDFHGDRFKLDVWALGCVLYSLYFKKQVPWYQLLDDYHGLASIPSVTERAKTKFNNLVKETIEEPLQALNQLIGPLSQEEAFRRIIYQMLRLNPKDRLDASQALVLHNSNFDQFFLA